MHRLLLDAIEQKKTKETARFIEVTHSSVLFNLTPGGFSVAMKLVIAGDLTNLKLVLNSHPKLYTDDNKGEQLLSLAMTHHHLLIATYLVELGCKFASTLHEQVALGTITLAEEQRVQQLVVSDATKKQPLEYAAAIGSAEKVNALIVDIKKHDIQIDFIPALKLAIANKHAHLFPLIIPNIQRIEERAKEIIESMTDHTDAISIIKKMIAEVADKDALIEKLITFSIVLGKKILTESLIKLYNKEKSPEKIAKRTELLDAQFILLMTLYFNKHKVTFDVIGAIAKGFSEDFKSRPELLNGLALQFFIAGMEQTAYILLNALPKELVSAAINADNESEVMRTVIKKSYTDTFYRLQYLGVRIDIPNKDGKTVEQVIISYRELQNQLNWQNREVIQEFIYDHMRFLDFLKEFEKTRTFDLHSAQQVVGKLESKKVPAKWVPTYVGTALHEMWRVATAQPSKMNRVFLSKVDELNRELMRIRAVDSELLYVSSARLKFILGNYKDALFDLERYECIVKAGVTIPMRAALFMQLYYSRLVLSIADAFNIKVSNSVTELSALSLIDFKESTIVGEGCFLDSVAAVCDLESIKKILVCLNAFVVGSGFYGRMDKAALENSNHLRSLISVFMGIESLNAWLDNLEGKITAKLLGDKKLELIVLAQHNQEKLETLRQFYQMRKEVHQFAHRLTAFYQKHVDHPDLQYVVQVFSEGYHNGVKRVKEKLEQLISKLCREESPSSELKRQDKKKKKPARSEPSKQTADKSEEESNPPLEADTTSLPTYYPDDRPYSTPVLAAAPKAPPVTSTPQTLFAAPKAITLIQSTPEDEKVHRLKQLGYNKKFPESLLYFIAKFNPGEVYVVGSAVPYVLDDTMPLPNDWDLLFDLTLETLQKRLVAGKEGVCEFRIKGKGLNQATTTVYKRTSEDAPLSIDGSRLIETGSNIEERLQKNSNKREVGVKSMILNPYAPKKSQIYDFNNGQSDLKQRKAALIKGEMENPLIEFPSRILRFILMRETGWNVTKKDEEYLAQSISYLPSLFPKRIRKDIIKIFNTVGPVNAETIFIKYKLYDIVAVKIEIEDIKKHPDLCRKKEVKLLTSEQTLASRQRVVKR